MRRLFADMLHLYAKKAALEIKTAKIFEILEQSITDGVYNQDKAHDLLKKYYIELGIIK